MVDELLQEARQGNRGAISALLNQHSGELRALAEREIHLQTVGQVDPSVLVDETLRRAQSQFGEFHGQTDIDWSNWLRLLLKDTVATVLEQDAFARAQMEDSESPTEGVQSPWVCPLPGESEPQSVAADDERVGKSERFNQALDALPAVQAHVVRLRLVHQWSLRRMAEHLGLDEVIVAGQLRLGLSHVRQAIESNCIERTDHE